MSKPPGTKIKANGRLVDRDSPEGVAELARREALYESGKRKPKQTPTVPPASPPPQTRRHLVAVSDVLEDGTIPGLVRRSTVKRAKDLLEDDSLRKRILAAIRAGTHARPACAAEGIPPAAFDSLMSRGRGESLQFHEGTVAQPTLLAMFYDAVEQAIGCSLRDHTSQLVASFDEFPRERTKWLMRRFGPEFAAAAARDDEIPAKPDEAHVRALLYSKLALGTRAPEIDVLAIGPSDEDAE